MHSPTLIEGKTLSALLGEVPLRRTVFAESAHAHRHLDRYARGIEIGAAAHNPFGIPGRIANVDYTPSVHTEAKAFEFKMCGRTEPVDVVAEAGALPYRTAELDFVLASHVLELVFDPIGTVEEWLRVVRPGGTVYMVLAHLDRIQRPHTLILPNRPGEPTPLAELRARTGRAAAMRARGETFEDGRPEGWHYSAWTPRSFAELIAARAWPCVDGLDPDDKVGNGFTVVLRKPDRR